MTSAPDTSPFCGVVFGGDDDNPEARDFVARAATLARGGKSPTDGPLRAVIIPMACTTRMSYRRATSWWTELLEDQDMIVEVLTPNNYKQLLAEADLIAVPDGNTEHAINYWIKSGIAGPIIGAMLRGVVVCGINAWSERVDFGDRLMDGLTVQLAAAMELKTVIRILPGAICLDADDIFENAHGSHTTGLTRREHFKDRLRAEPVRCNGIAADKRIALLIMGDIVLVIGAGLVTVHVWEDDTLVQRDYFPGSTFPLSDLELAA